MPIEVRKSIKARRLVFQPSDAFDEWSGEYLVLVPLLTLTFICLEQLRRVIEDGKSFNQISFSVLPVLALVVSITFTYLAIKRNRRLISIETCLEKAANRALVLQAMESLGWEIITNRSHYAIAFTTRSGFTWGQEIITLYDSMTVYVNCRNRLGGVPSARSPFLFGKGKQCLKLLIAELESRIPTAQQALAGDLVEACASSKQ